MKQSEIDAVYNLRSQGLKYAEIAKRLNMSLDAVKRRYYASNKTVTTPMAINHPEKVEHGPREAKVLFFDIETAPIRGWVWRPYEDNLIKTDLDWYMLCYAYKWAHEDEIKVVSLFDFPLFKKDKANDIHLVKGLHKLFSEADIIIGHNGDNFDLKKSLTRMVMHDMKPPSTYKSIDTLKVARRHFKFSSNRLNDLAQALKVGEKLPHIGSNLWFGCMEGKPESWADMKKYNIHDVYLLEKVYDKLKIFDKSHPNMNLYTGGDGCPKCLSEHIQKRGFEFKATTKRQRYQCIDCGSWFCKGPPIKKDDPLLAFG